MIRSTADRKLAHAFRDSTASLARCALAVALVACGDATDLKPVTPGEVGGGAAASGGASPAGNGGAAQKAGMGGTSSTGGASVGGAAGKGAAGAGGSSAGGASAGASGSGGASAGTSGSGGASAGTSGSGGASAGTSGSGGASGAGGEAQVMCPPILDPTPVTCGPGGSGVGTKCSEPDTACYFIDGSSGNPAGGSGGSGGSATAGGGGGSTPVACLPASDPSLLDLLPNHPFICGSNVSEVKGPPVCRNFLAGNNPTNSHGSGPACCYKVKYVGVCA